eukprot:scaffold141615_cov175-Phaeocystis_antarctica.AAC.1
MWWAAAAAARAARPAAARAHLRYSLALSLHSTHPMSILFLAGLNVSFPTRCGRSCGMPILLENRKEIVSGPILSALSDRRD